MNMIEVSTGHGSEILLKVAPDIITLRHVLKAKGHVTKY
jgi:hypothetical protein